MKTVYVLAAALLASASTAQPICQATDGLSILQWMLACESVAGDSAAKCADSACHAALHRLEEEETHECWEYLGLGTHEDFHKYEELDAFCHGETSGSSAHPVCEESDGLSILEWMAACDSITSGSAAKCADSACHAALHRLEEEETHECWEHLGLGTHDDFRKYGELDAFCHGEGPDPEFAPAPANSTQA
uniref:Uncharacterized protein n=1 Tax=Globisporangium ultimum (strain ATCC 200006 / CBS 805.95 / DAOM BR144) TaxID=431595 RepID=K3WNM0_GLOUD